MRIGLIGNYGSFNAGDEAILLGMTEAFSSINLKEGLVIFSHNPDDTERRTGIRAYPMKNAFPYDDSNKENGSGHNEKGRGEVNTRQGYNSFGLRSAIKRIKILRFIVAWIRQVSTMFVDSPRELKFWLRTYGILRRLDLLVFGGSNILMDQYRNLPFLFAKWAFLGKLAGCRVVFHSVGAGPIDTTKGKLLIKGALSTATTVLTRDHRSQEVLRGIGFSGEMKLTPDPAFLMNASEALGVARSCRDIGVKKKIALNPIPYFDSRYWFRGDDKVYNRYTSIMAQVVDKLIEAHGFEIIFLPMKYPADKETIFDILGKCSEKSGITIADKALDPLEIISLLARCQFAITTRYHGVILSGLAEIPVIAVAYHSKVFEVMKILNLEDLTIDISHLSYDILDAKVDYLCSHLEEVSLRMLTRVRSQKQDAAETFVQLYKKRLMTA